MSRHFIQTSALGTLFVTSAAVAMASGPTFWTVATVADLLKGTSDGVYVSLAGVLSPGPQLTPRLTTTPAQIWGFAEGPDGVLWAGTGGDGRMIRLRPGQPEETVADSDEANVFAIAVAGTRTYYATGPDGKVYVLEGNAPAREFFDPEQKYIWALAVDAAGRVWIGAGNPGVIYRVDAAGSGQAIYRPPAAHVVSLGRDNTGRMLAGTESPGRLYRFDSNDKPFVVFDSGMTELRAFTVDPTGAIYAAAVTRGDDASASETTSVALTLAAPAAPAAGSAPASTTSTPAKRSTLFRVDPSGAWEEVWSTPDLVYDVASQPDGVLVATGPEGRLYKVDWRRDVSLLTGVDAKQITRFASTGRAGSLAFATANPGRVVMVGSTTASPVTYTSPVRDTENVSSWGLIRWEAGGNVALSTRSGNTEKPDDSWSPWSGAYTRREGETITSPSARFLQWRAVLTPTPQVAPRLTGVTVAYLPQNTRPIVSSLTLYPPGVVFQRPYANDETAIAGLDDKIADARRAPGDSGPTPPQPTKRFFQRGLQTIAWKASDGDDDDLTHSLQYRREGETTWQDLKTDVGGDIFVWDTSTVADGRYVVRVRASDAAGNTAERALAGERESGPIEVDNTPPGATAEVLRLPNGLRLVVQARDARSPMQKLEYSIGDGAWQQVFPVDGLADSPDERYEIPLGNADEAARVMIRATDRFQNVVTQPALRR